MKGLAGLCAYVVALGFTNEPRAPPNGIDVASYPYSDSGGNPTLFSLWVPLNDVTFDNGAIHVVPKEFDEFFTKPDSPKHLLPFDQNSRRVHFEVGAAVALAPCNAGVPLAWHGSLIHWGGACSSFTESEPRISLTASLRVCSTNSVVQVNRLAVQCSSHYAAAHPDLA